MKIELDLSNVCIETASKQAYNRSVAQYFKADEREKTELEPVIDMLAHFLEVTDFKDLRHLHPDLRGGSDSRIEIGITNDKLIAVYCNQKELYCLAL